MKYDDSRNEHVTAKRVRELFRYDPETGDLYRRAPPRTRPRCDLSKPISTRDNNGYIKVRVDGRQHYAHRVIWLYVFGEWPSKFIDHINGRPDDNRMCNLREATNTQNQHNAGKWASNKSGYKGVTYHASWRSYKKWRACISAKGKKYELGHYETAEQAHEAYKAAAKRLHGDFANFGESP